MALTAAEVEHIAHLARLHLTDKEKERFREQLSSILEHVARLQALETAEILPTSSVLPESGRLRPDEVQPGLEREALLSNAPETEGGQFRVPPVLD
jgi:aspartyl-tRNA(Asn)/glutamyl-tRNA(Gln) amidotransferase subunit C